VLCEARLDRAGVLEYLDQCGAPTENGEPEPPGRL